MKRRNQKEEMINKIRNLVGLDPTKKFGNYSVKELRGYALFAQILDEKGFEPPAHWDNWKWDPENKTMSVKVYWWQSEIAYDHQTEEPYRSLNQRGAWVHFEDTKMNGGCVKAFFKRFKNAPLFIDWSEVYEIKARALPEPVDNEDEEDE